MLAVAKLAASATEATGTLAAQFAFRYAAIRLVLVALYLRAYRHVAQARGLIVVYLTAGAIAAGLWLAGAMVSGPARYAAWVVAVATEVIAPVVATRRSAGLPCILSTCQSGWGCWSSGARRIDRCGSLRPASRRRIGSGPRSPWRFSDFVAAVSLWWTYFDLAGAAATRTLVRRAGHRSTLLHDVYAYGHWPLTPKAAAGVGLEGVILEGGQPTLTSGTRWLLCGG